MKMGSRENTGRRYDIALQLRAAALLSVEPSNKAIAARLRIGLATVERYRRVARTWGVVVPPRIGKGVGRPRIITVAAAEGLKDHVNSCDQSPTIEEMRAYLFDIWDLECSIPTVWRTATKQLNLSHKRGERVNLGRNDQLRGEFASKMMSYRASQLVVVDESASNERNLDRRWGWSEKGIAYRMVNSTATSKRWSILPAIGINGYLECEIFQGSFNSERFALFVQKLLKKMNPFPGPRSVLIMDNCSTHHSGLIRPMCEAVGVRLEYLPPYSPDMSPIEESFSVLKSWIRKNRKEGVDFAYAGSYGWFLYIAVELSDIRAQARGYFRHCGYTVDDEDQDIAYELLETVIVGSSGVED